jgi:FKBP-type peptidyl-prolyl cis-trans isomerase (trigger factor)
MALQRLRKRIDRVEGWRKQNRQIHLPADWEVEELQGKDVEIEATVKTVRGVTLPDLNDEFAKMTGAGETWMR